MEKCSKFGVNNEWINLYDIGLGELLLCNERGEYDIKTGFDYLILYFKSTLISFYFSSSKLHSKLSFQEKITSNLIFWNSSTILVSFSNVMEIAVVNLNTKNTVKILQIFPSILKVVITKKEGGNDENDENKTSNRTMNSECCTELNTNFSGRVMKKCYLYDRQ